MRSKNLISKVFFYVIIVVLLLYTLFPIYWTIITSIETQEQLISMPKIWFPVKVNIQRYAALFFGKEVKGTKVSGVVTGGFTKSFSNSLIVSLFVVGISVFFGSLAGFSFHALQFPAKEFLFNTILAIVVFPYITLLPALYRLFDHFHLLDTLLGLVILYSGFTLPIAIWLMRGYFGSIPSQLMDAAKIDGCSYLSYFFKIAVPLCAPGIVSVMIISFIGAWNEFLGALILTHSIKAKTLPVILAEFQGAYSVSYGLIAAGAVIAIIPTFIFVLFFQKYLVKGLTEGAVKG